MESYSLLRTLPESIGFDVLNEVALTSSGLQVVVLREQKVEPRRAIGASDRGRHGRYRDGRVCRWTGYFFLYFILHLLRYILRRPYLSRAVAMWIRYLTAAPGPCDFRLKRGPCSEPTEEMRELIRHPIHWLRTTYGY